MLLCSRLARLAGLLLALAGCSPLAALDAITPSGDYGTTADLAYGADPRQRLDVYRPREGGRHKVIVFFYGGNWKTGNRADYRFVAESLTRRGFVVVIPDYRLFPSVRFPTFLEDGAKAIAWTFAEVARHGGDTGAIYLMGHSAGAYNTMMLALDTPYLAAAGVERLRLAGVIGIAGPYDFLPLGPDIAPIFAPAGDPTRTQPIAFVGPSPPALLLTGAADDTVRPGNTTRLAAALRARGTPARDIIYPGIGHIEILLGLSTALRGGSPVLADIAAFARPN